MKKLFISRLAKRSPGTGMVEFAMGDTIFLMLMFAIIELAIVVYSYNTISHAARECVRYAIVIRRPAPTQRRPLRSRTSRLAMLICLRQTNWYRVMSR